ncbi:MAG: hypothetical protein KAQ68_00185 [Clostridiales bacterium]|nr:hypothetical protein [Clostridiales bacterium]
MIKARSKRKIDLWLSIFLVTVVVLLAGVTYITGDLSTYMATPLAIANDGIFTNDFSIMEFVRPNAQSISDNIMALFLKIGISWQALSLVGYIITVIIFAAAIIATSKRIAGEKYYIVAGTVMFFALYALSGLRIGRNPIWYPSFYYAQLAFSIGVWGFVKALDKKWYQAFIVFAVATLIHFTAGSYCAAFVLVFIIIEAVKSKNYKLLIAPLIWIASAIAIFAMMTLSGTTGTGILSNDAFVKIHAYLRHPHHHVPSTWEKLEWVNYICYMAAVFLVFYYSAKDSEIYKKIKAFFFITTGLMAGILLINFVFVEIIPVAFIAKLQPARNVFIYRFFLAIILSYSVFRLIGKKEYYAAALVIFMATLPQMNIKTYSGILLLLIAVYLLFNRYAKKKNITSLQVLLHMASIVLVILTISLYAANIALLVKVMYIVAYIILLAVTVMVDELKDKKGEKHFIKIIAALLALGIIMIPWVDITGNFTGLKIKSPKYVISLSDVDFSVQALAQRFNEKTEKDVIFLGDPNDISTAYFRIFSLRASVVAFKNMPFTDEGMKEWVDRLSSLKAVTTDENGYYIRNKQVFDDLTAVEIIDVAQTYDAEYLLVDFDEEKLIAFYSMGATRFDTEGRWTMLQLQ